MASEFKKTYIREWRKFRDLSIRELATLMGHANHSHLSRLERGLAGYTQENLESLATILGCQPVDLLLRDPSEPDTIWTVWAALTPEKRQHALDYLCVLKESQALEKKVG